MDSYKKEEKKRFEAFTKLGSSNDFTLCEHGTLNSKLGILTSKQTEQKVHAHTSNCQKDVACRFTRHEWTRAAFYILLSWPF